MPRNNKILIRKSTDTGTPAPSKICIVQVATEEVIIGCAPARNAPMYAFKLAGADLKTKFLSAGERLAIWNVPNKTPDESQVKTSM